MTTKSLSKKDFAAWSRRLRQQFQLIGPVRQGDQFNFIALGEEERPGFFLSKHAALSERTGSAPFRTDVSVQPGSVRSGSPYIERGPLGMRLPACCWASVPVTPRP